ncbi:hypothetical protein [Rhodococcus opacus]|uniref:Uncharacterized protein n=1 Tax=Rhodococcus opacus (strain B4) TaxID=632772 RepID=C1B983_RHOOB|nr:hypothetical protein [Rhodococcus opacus]BAH52236.1 hypothetical protein ROP_39890 [Rhodococcus opacus B4]
MTDSQARDFDAEDFLASRREWLEVSVVEVEKDCFDVVLKIDGTYFDRETADRVAESFARDVRALLPEVDQ